MAENSVLFQNARVVLPGEIALRDVRVTEGWITAIEPHIQPMTNERTLALGGAYLMPGFIDTHMHGAAGCVYTNPEDDLNKITAYEATRGVTTVTATIGARPEGVFENGVKNVLAHIRRGTEGARIVGIHAEGPFLNPKRRGSMRAEDMRPPTVEAFRQLYDICEGELKLLSIAPEVPGALDVVREAVRAGISVSAGHTDATFDEMRAGIDAGISRMTHTFNASRPLNHREPGVLGAALCDPRVTCEVICDFAHLHPSVVEMIYRAKGSGRFTAISDAAFCAGLPDGEYDIAGSRFIVGGGVARHPDGTISGSAGDLLLAAQNLHSLGIPLWEIAEMTALNPAKALGIDHHTGSIAKGRTADFVVLDENLTVCSTFVSGRCVYERAN
ncbi:MAG: N-acetylglucosamine-6-phosphate deacetylase [Clostridia bacterium]|nr:N-acetylglucosamine-6-phosphate deacetylase [Clostridia bacterium]